MYTHMVVSEIGVPLVIIHFTGIFLDNPTIFDSPMYGPPHIYIYLYIQCEVARSQLAATVVPGRPNDASNHDVPVEAGAVSTAGRT